MWCVVLFFFFVKQKTAYEMRISDWSSDVCSSDLLGRIKLKLADEIGKARAVRDAALLAIDVKVQHIGHQAGIDAWAADVNRRGEKSELRRRRDCGPWHSWWRTGTAPDTLRSTAPFLTSPTEQHRNHTRSEKRGEGQGAVETV